PKLLGDGSGDDHQTALQQSIPATRQTLYESSWLEAPRQSYPKLKLKCARTARYHLFFSCGLFTSCTALNIAIDGPALSFLACSIVIAGLPSSVQRLAAINLGVASNLFCSSSLYRLKL